MKIIYKKLTFVKKKIHIVKEWNDCCDESDVVFPLLFEKELFRCVWKSCLLWLLWSICFRIEKMNFLTKQTNKQTNKHSETKDRTHAQKESSRASLEPIIGLTQLGHC